MKKNRTKKVSTASHDYDHASKQIFSHPIMVESLIRGFILDKWTQDLDFTSLHKLNVQHTTDDLRTRDNDIIWRVNFREMPLYIICMIEFQSSIDPYMSVRILTYIGLVYQDLIKQKKIKNRDFLPPVLPLVLYTGEKP